MSGGKPRFIHGSLYNGAFVFITLHTALSQPTFSFVSKWGRNLLGRFLQRSYSKECWKFLSGVFSRQIITSPQTFQASRSRCRSVPPPRRCPLIMCSAPELCSSLVRTSPHTYTVCSYGACTLQCGSRCVQGQTYEDSFNKNLSEHLESLH